LAKSTLRTHREKHIENWTRQPIKTLLKDKHKTTFEDIQAQLKKYLDHQEITDIILFHGISSAIENVKGGDEGTI